MGYLIAFVAGILVVLWGISIYFVKTGRLSADEWFKKSLGLPQGTVRAILAFLLLFLLIFSALGKTILPELPGWLVGIMGSVIGFYFGSAMVTKPAKESSKSEEDTTPKPQ